MAQDETTTTTKEAENDPKRARISDAERRERLTELVLRRSKLSASEAALLREAHTSHRGPGPIEACVPTRDLAPREVSVIGGEPEVPMRLSLNRAETSPISAVLSGLSSQETPAVPEWAQADVDTRTWTGATLDVDKLIAALNKLPGHALEQVTTIPWTCDGDVLAVDITMPLLLLARDLTSLGKNDGCVTLEGS